MKAKVYKNHLSASWLGSMKVSFITTQKMNNATEAHSIQNISFRVTKLQTVIFKLSSLVSMSLSNISIDIGGSTIQEALLMVMIHH